MFIHYRAARRVLAAACVLTASAAASPPDVTDASKTAAQSSNAFGIDLYRALAKGDESRNLFLSPYSMSVALTMTAQGAAAETEAEMARVMHFPATPQKGRAISALHEGNAELTKWFAANSGAADPATRKKIDALKADLAKANAQAEKLQNANNWQEAHAAAGKAESIAAELNAIYTTVDRFDLRSANALWIERGFPLHKDFVGTINHFYGTDGVTSLDISKKTEKSRQTINAWVEKNTENRIKDLIPKGALEPDTRLVITNAVYFKGQWAAPFAEGSTREENFAPAAGAPIRVKMMHDYRYGTPYAAFNADGSYFDTPQRVPKDKAKWPATYPDDGGFTMIALPYKGGQLSMVLLAPRTPTGLAALESKLTAESLDAWLTKFNARTVNTFMPRFTLESSHDMSQVLQSLGMKRAFTDPAQPGGAQFPGITDSMDPNQRVFIGAVLHKAWVDVTEKGTEAAAATSVMMRPASAAPMREETEPFTPEFRADRPFLFLIRDSKTGLILFMGRMVKPAAA